MKYVCKVCGFIYDTEKGEPARGIKQGTTLEDLPYDWECQVCEVGKDMLEKQDQGIGS